jgi:peptidoglycan/LPS O-acetylase OafA/YrhL
MKRTAAESAGLTFAAVTLIANAARWFSTPMSHPDASHWQTARVVIQFAIGIAAAVYASHRLRLEREVEREDAGLDRTR